ncbi:MAG: hypothetical protein C0591_14190 [Marinilabiliales bacterium]|jgi:hypothetical protein|nr:MAG: hypothetical protein C0591_14190 [Marinilabiliales bacterium]
MKKKEVPQDDANMMQGKFREPVYSLDEDGNYTTVKSVGWDPKNAVMQQAWDHINEKVEETKQKVINGQLSPIAYYMEKNIMDVTLLSKYMGLWKWTVKKHLKPKHFNKLSENLIAQYADIFNITPVQLKDINALK